MPSPQEPRPRGRSAFAAAFLSLIFPGLGHAYAGVYQRALAFAAPPILLLALFGGIALRMNRAELLGYLVANLGPLFVVNVILLAYRAVAIVDAWRVVTYLNAYDVSGGGRLGRPRIGLAPVPVAGLLAVLLVMAGVHVAVAQYDLKFGELVSCVFDDTGTATCDGGAGASPGPSDSPDASAGSPAPSQTTAPAWNGSDRLNILLIGSDQRPAEGTYNTDTLIVVSIDPATKQVAMFSLPRDTVDVPVPSGPAQAVFGTTYRGKINSWLTANRGRADLWPGPARNRGYTALKAILGNLYGLDIKYFVEVNFDGFRKVVDTLGGVTINVQVPVVDDNYPGDLGYPTRVYIPAGVQHMTGAQALIYARSRHGSNDFDRGQRQQRVLLSLRQQIDPALLVPKISDLVDALKTAVKTDIPVGLLPQLMSLGSEVDTGELRSFVFAPPLYETEVLHGDPRGYVVIPHIDRIRQAVRDAFTVDPAAQALRQKLSEEAATIWVLNGTGRTGQASRLATFLESTGLDASAPNQRPDTRGLSATRIVVYNGAEAKLPATIAYLEKTLGVTSTTANDPSVHVDVIVTTAASTPDLTAPPTP